MAILDGPTIREDDLTDPRVTAFIADHLDEVLGHAPPCSEHALDVGGLRAGPVTLWTAWSGEDVVGMVGLKRLSADHGEVKSMRVAPGMRRSGLGARLVDHLIAAAKSLGMTRVSLETGVQDVFIPAIALYRRMGFVDCAPFADYRDDPNSVFMTRAV